MVAEFFSFFFFLCWISKTQPRRLKGTDFVLNRFFSKAVQNVHNLSFAGYCEQDRSSLYGMGERVQGRGYSQSRLNLRSA